MKNKQLDIIVCIMGCSGSGKTTVSDALVKQSNYNNIISYTTRKPRFEGEQGHIFIDKPSPKYFGYCPKTDKYIPSTDGVIAYTIFDGNYYYATKDQYKDKGVTLYVIDQFGLQTISKRIKDAYITAVFLDVPENVRIQRMKQRGDSDEAIQQRIKNDREQFKDIRKNVNEDVIIYTIDATEDVPGIVHKIESAIYLSKQLAQENNQNK